MVTNSENWAFHMKKADEMEPIMDAQAADVFHGSMRKMISALPKIENLSVKRFDFHVHFPGAKWIAKVEYQANDKDDHGFRPYEIFQGNGDTPTKAFDELIRMIYLWAQILL